MKATMAGRLVLVVAGLLMAGTAAGAQGFGGGQGVGPGFGNRRPPMERAFGAAGGNKGWWNNPRIAERLKLTDDQRKAMDGILLQHREKLIDLQANLQKAELTMQPLMGADTPNSAAITAQISASFRGADDAAADGRGHAEQRGDYGSDRQGCASAGRP